MLLQWTKRRVDTSVCVIVRTKKIAELYITLCHIGFAVALKRSRSSTLLFAISVLLLLRDLGLGKGRQGSDGGENVSRPALLLQ